MLIGMLLRGEKGCRRFGEPLQAGIGGLLAPGPHQANRSPTVFTALIDHSLAAADLRKGHDDPTAVGPSEKPPGFVL
ncbi:hypothetical protein SAE02_74500 [Skermanella aerolata]|uniref:Uncharacterized protein n=1 Tax=Skermanella aerolata TaxID=393310 RepID=A0A512E3J2_9PROT|nr:hypothetical protein [Skermanella aerolata]GEO43302.1 hypothetical protein SAE02_74500 [Skermanella aerolata]